MPLNVNEIHGIIRLVIKEVFSQIHPSEYKPFFSDSSRNLSVAEATLSRLRLWKGDAKLNRAQWMNHFTLTDTRFYRLEDNTDIDLLRIAREIEQNLEWKIQNPSYLLFYLDWSGHRPKM